MEKISIYEKKIFFCVFTGLLLLVSCFCMINILTGRNAFANLNYKWDGKTVATEFSGGNGSESNPYKIANSYELAYLEKVVNEQAVDETNGGYYYDKYYELVRDIDLGGYTWKSIGNSDVTSFKGKFDAKGYTIYNLSINNESNAIENYYGLFGKIENGEVDNLIIDGININVDNFSGSGDKYIGSVAGLITKDDIVTGNETIINSPITSFNNLVLKNITIAGKYTSADNLYISEFSGKNEGNLRFDNILIDSVNSFTTQDDTNLINGVLTGYNENSLYTNVLYIGNSKEFFGKISNDISNVSLRLYSVSENTIYSYQYSDIASGYSLVAVEDELSNIINNFNTNSIDSNYEWKIDEEKVVLSKIDEDVSEKVTVTGLLGDGSIEHPYLISSEEDLSYLREKVNEGNSFDGFNFQLASDIVLVNDYSPIGNTNNSFKGNFDGAGHSISNMNIKITSNNSSVASFGFFGSIGNGSSQTIKNIEFINPSITLDITYSSSVVNGYNIGTVAGTMYNNSNIENIIVNDLTIRNSSSFVVNSRNYRMQVGGIAGVATNTPNSENEPDSSKYYSIKNCYVSSDINTSNITVSSRAYALYVSTGGIIGGVYNQASWPENCLYEGSINSPSGFIGPIFGYVRTATGYSTSNFNTYFQGNGIRSLTATSYFNNYTVRGKTFTSSNSNGNVSNNTNYRYSTSTNNIGYVQGVNKGLYLNSYTTKEALLNSWNESNNNIEFTYTNGKYHFKKRFDTAINDISDYYYKVDISNEYNSPSYTYAWYKDNVLETNFTNSTYSYDASNVDKILVDSNILCVVYDGAYYSVARKDILKPSIDLVVNVDKNNKSVSTYLTGDALNYTSPSDYTYTWYREDITGLDSGVIEGITSSSITGLDPEYDYRVVATNTKYPSMSVEKDFLLEDRTVIFVSENNGNNNNDGLTEETAVKTIQNAYTKLSSDGSINTNIIVLIGNYTTNDFLYQETTTTANNYSKNATITGYYRSKDYNSDLYFTGAAPSNNTTGRYLYADTRLMYLNLNGTGNRQTYLYCQGHSLVMGKEITLSNYNSTSNTNGMINDTTAPDFHIIGGFNNRNVNTLPDENNNGTITIQSGTYARIILGSRNTKINSTSNNFTGLKNKPFTMKLNIDIAKSTTNYNNYKYDVNLVVGGQTDGNIYASSVINAYNGNLGRVIGGSIGYSDSSRTSSSFPLNTFLGDTAINIFGGQINELYGTSLGRSNNDVSDNTYFYGKATININGGIIDSNIYSAGAGGVTGYSDSSSDPFKNYGKDYESSVNLNITSGTINGNIYGAGYGYSSYVSSSEIAVDGGTLYGDSNITISGGNILGSIYGAGRGTNSYGTSRNKLAQMQGNSTITIKDNALISGDIYGAGEGINNNSYQDSAKLFGNSKVYIEKGLNVSVYGGGNAASVSGTTNVYIKNGEFSNDIYAGGNLGDVSGTSNITLENGKCNNIYGGGKNSDVTNTAVSLLGGSAKTVYGGGMESNISNTTVSLLGSNIDTIYGGSNQAGVVTSSNVNIDNGSVNTVYGGNNAGGKTTTSNIDIKNIDIANVYGGGNNADSSSSNVIVNSGTVNNLYGGGNLGDITNTSIDIKGGTITNLYGGGNLALADDTVININGGVITDAYGGGNKASALSSNVFVNSGNITNLYGGGNEAGVDNTNVELNGGFITNIYGGSNTSGNVDTTNILVKAGNYGDLYGGNNKGGTTGNSNIEIVNGSINNLFGGGNKAITTSTKVTVKNAIINNLYGGGNASNVDKNTYVDLDNATINSNLYGGGNEGEVSGNTQVFITDTNILGSAYAGGNGATAKVYGNTTINIDGSTVVGTENSKAPDSGCVFGSGNAAAGGTKESNNSVATVNIVGATIYGNVYGGANTSVVYGKTHTNIGTDAVKNSSFVEGDINILGTVFGGGEANASGSEVYDYSFICVTISIDINIDGSGYLSRNHKFNIAGSIFGSGNASSSEGTSEIYISNLGTKNSPSKNISIQRADKVIIDNSVIELEGTTDRTNEYSTIKYSFNRIDSLTIKNNTTLLLKQNANLLKELNSTVDIDGKEVKAQVEINDETKTVTKNVDNRIYLIPNRNLNITTSQTADSYGKISGMTFFGMYNSYSESNSFSYGIYDSSFNYGDSTDAGDVIIGGSYILGLHNLNHDTTVDGFYSNFINDEYTEISTAYIEPSPPDSNYYMWSVGLQAINYSFSLTASKYSSLGTYELSMLEFSKGDTTFEVIGFNSEGLAKDVQLIDSNLVPKVTETDLEANQILGLSMKSETREWTNYGNTKFLSKNNGSYTGTKSYKTDSQMVAPSLMFYLYHAKNITLDGELGTVGITLQALTPKNEIEYDVQLITITIELNAREYDDGNSYDASITYDKKYEMPSATSVNITNQSQFTSYYSIIANSNTLEDFYGINNSNYHVLTTNYPLPVGTQVTMLDYGIASDNPEYYYYTITDEIYANSLLQLEKENEITYKISEFTKMGSIDSSNKYSDSKSNEKYYSKDSKRVIEEFIFIFDFKNTNATGTHTNNSILFELRNNEDRTLVSVLGIRQNLMVYNTYDSSNIILNETINNSNEYLYYDVDNLIEYSTIVDYDQTDNRQAIIDTNYESSNMGFNLTIIDSSNNQISSSLLSGTKLRIDNTEYFADSDGVYRVKLAGKVSNLNRNVYLTVDNLLPAGSYTLKIVLFASDDGLHNSSLLESSVVEIPVIIVGDNNYIDVTSSDETKVVDGNNHLNSNGNTYNRYVVKYHSELSNPNVRVSIYKRDTTSSDSTVYNLVSFDQVFKNSLLKPSDASYIEQYQFERMININQSGSTNLNLELQEQLVSGTYKIVFRLYDRNQQIDEEVKYVIIKKNLE